MKRGFVRACIGWTVMMLAVPAAACATGKDEDPPDTMDYLPEDLPGEADFDDAAEADADGDIPAEVLPDEGGEAADDAPMDTDLEAEPDAEPDVEPDPEPDVVPDGPACAEYVFTFESIGDCGGGFIADGTSDTDWQCGIPAAGQAPARPEGDEQVWGTGINNDCSESCGTIFLTSPLMDLGAAAGGVEVRLDHFYDTDSNGTYHHDGGFVQASADGGSGWETINPVGHYPGLIFDSSGCTSSWDGDAGYVNLIGEDWGEAVFRLDESWATSRFMLRFVYSTDYSSGTPGWFIDDVRVEGVGPCTGE